MRSLLLPALILVSAALALSATAQTTITYTNGETNSTVYDTTANNYTLSIASGTATQSGVLSGTGTVEKSGAGSLTLSGANTYSGGTTVSAGTLTISTDSNLGTGAVSVTGGTLSGTGSLILNRGTTVTGPSAQLTTASYIGWGTNGAGSLTVSGGGTVTSGSTTSFGQYAGDVGTGTVSGTGSLLTSTLDLYLGIYSASNGTLTIENGGTVRAPRLNIGVFSGSSGTLNLNAGGTLQTGSANAIINDAGSAHLNFNGGTLQVITADLTTDVALTLGSGTDSSVDTNGFNATLVGVISGAGALTKTGTGTLTLSGANTYSGSTTVNAGTLNFVNSGAYYGGTVDATTAARLSVAHGAIATFNVGDTGYFSDADLGTVLAHATFASGASLGIDTSNATGGTFTMATVLADTNSGANALGLQKFGAGNLTLNGANTYSGGTVINAGTLTLAHSNALGATTGSVTVASGATLAFTNNITVGNAAIANSGTITNTSDANTYAGVISGSGGVTVTTGFLTLNGANTYSGGTVVNAGTLILGNASALGATTGNLTLNGGTIDLGATSPTVGSATFNGGTFTNGNLNHAAAFEVQTGSLSANLGGSAALTKTGSGNFTLSGANSYAGTTTVSAGTLCFTDRGAYYGGTLDATTAAKLSVASGATATFGVGDTGYFSTGDLATILAHTSFASGSSLGIDTTHVTGGTLTWADPGLGNTGLSKSGTGTLAFDAGLSATGPLTILAGTLQLGNGGTTALGASTITNDGTLVLNHSNDLTFAGTLSGTGAFTKSGTGKLTITSFSSTGGFTVSGGELALGSSGNINDQAVIVTGSGSVLSYTSGPKNVGNSGTGSLSISNGADVINTSTNSFSGRLYVGASTGSTGTVTVNGSGSTLTWSRLYAGYSGTGTLNVESGATATFSLVSDSYLGYQPTGAGTVNLSGTNSSLTTAGQLIVGNYGAGTVNLGTGATLTANRLLLADFAGSTGTLNLNTGGTLVVSDATATAISSGAGTVTFNFAGGTLKSDGSHSLSVSSNATLGTGTTSTVDTNGQTGTWSGILSGSGSLTKSGTGTLTLSAANTYTGTTTVSAGTLTLGASGSLASSSLSIATGATFDVSAVTGGFVLGPGQTLGGTGTIAGLATIGSGATLAPGNSPGTITVTNGLTLDPGAVLDFQLGTVSDLIAITGGTLTGPSSGTVTLNLSDSGGFSAGTYTLFDYTAATGTSSFDLSDFALGTTVSGYSYSLGFNGNTLELTTVSAVPEPATWAAIFGLAALGLAIVRRRRTA